MRNWIFLIFLSFFFGIFGGILADQILWPYFVERPLFQKYRLEPTPIYLTEKKEIIVQENTALKDAVDIVKKSTFFVETIYKGKEIKGSGFILTSDGLAVTLASLVPFGGKFTFYVEKEPVHFQILKRDFNKNLALIKFEKEDLVTRSFFDLEKLKLGERIFLFSQFQKEKSIETLIDEGIVKSFNKDYIETNFTKDPRILGAPVFDIKGDFLGLIFFEKEKVLVLSVKDIKKFSGF
jgi:S1-C subfamily serine protease